MTSSTLLNSSSLKDLLLGVSDVRKRKVAAARSEEMVGAILKQDAFEGEMIQKRLRARAMKKKKSNKKRSILDRTGAATGLQRARLMTLNFNNAFEYARELGIERDSIDILERQFMYSEITLKETLSKLRLGLEQLDGPSVTEITPQEADLLLTLLGIDMTDQALTVDGVTLPLANHLDDPRTNHLEHTSTHLLEEHEQKQFKDNMNIINDSGNVTEKIYRHAVPIDETRLGKLLNFDRFARVVENFIRKKLLVLYLGEAKGCVSRYAKERFLHPDGGSISNPYAGNNYNSSSQQDTMGMQGVDSTLYGSTSQLEMGGQMDGSLYDTQPDPYASTMQNTTAASAREQNMFVSSVTLGRPHSGPSGEALAPGPPMRLEHSATMFSHTDRLEEDGSRLPPLKLLRNNMKKQKKELSLTLGKKHFTKAGFDSSFTRSTPRVLQNKPQPSRDLYEGGGATIEEIEALRYELAVAKEGIKHLDSMVDTNIAWVQHNCDMSAYTKTLSYRSKLKCQYMATERICSVYSSYIENTLYWAVLKWKNLIKYEKISHTIIQYTKIKAIEKLTVSLWKVITNQMLLKGWKPWLKYIQTKILADMNKASIQIQKIIRGRLGRIRFNRIKLGEVAIRIQNLFRKTKAIALIKEKRYVKENNMNNMAIKMIQKLFSKLIKIRLAKKEVQKLKENRATIRIQKIHRGRQARKEFLQTYLKKQQQQQQQQMDVEVEKEGKGDLEKLAATATLHNTHKRSLFNTDHSDHPTSTTSTSIPPAASPKTRNKSAPLRGKPTAAAATSGRTEHSPHRLRKSMGDAPPDAHRPKTPNPPSVLSPVGEGQVAKSSTGVKPRSGAKATSSPVPTKTTPASTHKRRESPTPSSASSQPAQKITKRHSSGEKNKSTTRTGKNSAAHTAAGTAGGIAKTSSRSPSRSGSRPPSALKGQDSSKETIKEIRSRPGSPSLDVETLRKSILSVSPTEALPSTTSADVESIRQSEEKLTAESQDDDVLSSDAMRAMLQRQNSAQKIQKLVKSRVNKRSSVDASTDLSKPKHQPTKRRSYDNNNTTANKASTRQPATGTSALRGRKLGSLDSSAVLPPEAAVTNIQKLARGKLARARSKKLLEDKELSGSSSKKPVEDDSSVTAIVPPPEGWNEEEERPRTVSEAMEKVRAEFQSDSNEPSQQPSEKQTLQQKLSEKHTPLAAAEQSPSRPGSEQRARPANISTQSDQWNSSSAAQDSSVRSSKPSTPLSARISSSLRSFRLPGFNSAAQSREASESPPQERPKSSNFFRNPFSGWGSRGNSRETTPAKQRPNTTGTTATTGASADSHSESITFSKPSTIPENPEVDLTRKELSVRLIQARARGMRDRQRVAMIRDERKIAMEATAEAAAATLSPIEEVDSEPAVLKPVSAPTIPTKPLSAARNTNKRGATASADLASKSSATATVAAVRRSSLNKQDKERSVSTGRRASFDKEGETKASTTRRSSFDKTAEGNANPKLSVRRSSFDRNSESPVPSRGATAESVTSTASKDGNKKNTLRRSSFDRSTGESSFARRGSFGGDGNTARQQQQSPNPQRLPSSDHERSTSTARRASFNKEKSAARRASFDKESDKSTNSTAKSGTASKPSSSLSQHHHQSKSSEDPGKVSSVEEEKMRVESEDVANPLPAEFATAVMEGAEFLDYTPPSGQENSEFGADTPSEGVDDTVVSDSHGEDSSTTPKTKPAKANVRAKPSAAAHDRSKGKDGAGKERSVRRKDSSATEDSRRRAAADGKKDGVSKHSRIQDKQHKSVPAGNKKPDSKPSTPASVSGARTHTIDPSAGEHSHGPSAPSTGRRTPKPSVSPKPPTSKPPTPHSTTTSRSPTPKKQAISSFKRPEIEPSHAALKIQNRIRSQLSKKKVEEKKKEVISAHKKLGMLVHWAVVTIQRNYRGRHGRKRFQEYSIVKQVELAKKKELCAQKIQSRARGALGRQKAHFVKELQRKERREAEWAQSYQKSGSRKKAMSGSDASSVDAQSTASSASKKRRLGNTAAAGGGAIESDGEEGARENPPLDPAAAKALADAAAATAKQTEEMNERFQKLAEMERQLKERADQMEEFERASKAREEAMDRALKLIEEQSKKAEADRLAQQQLLMMAAGPMSHRSEFASPYSTQQRRNPLASARRSVPNSSRIPEAPPTARSARGGAGIPPDAPRMTYHGQEWVQLWDPDEAAYYWYCEATQVAQWEAPGSANNASAVTVLANYNYSEGEESGYESAGAMTDYSTDHYDESSMYTDGSDYDNTVWHEYWDESAQAKYWYNEITGEASWTKPESALTAGSGDDALSSRLAITDGLEGSDTAGSPAAGGTNEWVSYIDEETEQAYWYNVRTGETSWA